MKNGKIYRRIGATALAATTLGSMVACGPQVVQSSNVEGKTKIYISLSSGGHGTDYFDKLIEDFMAKNPEYDKEYYIDYVFENKHKTLVEEELKKSPGEKQMYIMNQNAIVSLAYQGLLEDVSDVATMKVDSHDKTIAEKMYRYDEWKDIYSVYGEGLYALPYADSIMGFVYDHQMFLDNKWYNFAGAGDKTALTQQGITYREDGDKLYFVSSTSATNYKENDRILSAGKDGKYGTYDDGQPITEAEFDALVKKISLTTKTFISSGQIGSYAMFAVAAIFAQYAGIDNFESYFTYDSNGRPISFTDGTEEPLTLENGYKSTSMTDLYKAYEWLEKYFDTRESSKIAYNHRAVSDSTVNHTDTQSLFLTGYMNTTSNPQSAMLLEGAWWEYEARRTFQELGKLDASRGYGAREYRYMLLPNLDGQKNTKSVMATCECGSMFLPKDSNKERLAVTKAFLAYMASDEAVKTFTTITGCPMPYDVEFTAQEQAKLTPFTRNMMELYYDSENVDIVRPPLLTLSSPLAYASSRGEMGAYLFCPRFDGSINDQPFKTVRTYNLDKVKTGLQDVYKASDWATFIAEAKQEGFFKA